MRPKLHTNLVSNQQLKCSSTCATYKTIEEKVLPSIHLYCTAGWVGSCPCGGSMASLARRRRHSAMSAALAAIPLAKNKKRRHAFTFDHQLFWPWFVQIWFSMLWNVLFSWLNLQPTLP